MNTTFDRLAPQSALNQQSDAVSLTRRSFLIGSVAGGLVMGFGGILTAKSARAELSARRFSPAVWFEMDASGITQINIAKAEMGQHVGTALARILADELGVAWADVRIKHVDSDPRWGYMVTGGSWSVFTSFTLLSQAGAAGRQDVHEHRGREEARATDDAAGDQVLLLYGSANHDEAVFDDPDVLDLDRDVRRHWSFGSGIHHCLGNAIARLETRVALQALIDQIPDSDRAIFSMALFWLPLRM